MRELDELLIRYLESRYRDADEEEKVAFEAVLALSDPELNGYLLQRQTPSSKSIAGVIELILSPPHA
jgi:succinate dehydrogenase flavin-adding protein (antitoxin of CptAB toxin-antitoxin module)